MTFGRCCFSRTWHQVIGTISVGALSCRLQLPKSSQPSYFKFLDPRVFLLRRAEITWLELISDHRRHLPKWQSCAL
ncbi:hypothetical protein CPB83DRAFT_848686 [Crepidotus variabilis]|uniref:Uncharacterized protein n=1 Tax=Crepidotus variabilis TaxID=179855 RepID=A0A9P6EMQ3_9AGAR|nr:hypothetical protein CPB83DRAFT_848686 [Crepidotus variabilis]